MSASAKGKQSRFDSYSVRNSVLNISHITFRDCRVHSFSDNLSRNSCIRCQHFWRHPSLFARNEELACRLVYTQLKQW